MEPRDQFTFYRSYWEALRRLPKKDRLPALEAVITYALYGDEPESLPPAGETAFILIRPTLDTGRRKAAIGKQGGKNKKANSKQTGSKPEASGKQTGREIEKEVEIEIEKEKELENDSYNNCPEPKKGSELVAISLLLNDKSEYPIMKAQVDKWSKLYPAVDVMQQLRSMRGWLEANPSRRKTKGGILRFVTAWLAKKQDQSHTPQARAEKYAASAERVQAGTAALDEYEREAIARMLREYEQLQEEGGENG